MEVWIETCKVWTIYPLSYVTSHVEVWIETELGAKLQTFNVTSHVEVWIETNVIALL